MRFFGKNGFFSGSGRRRKCLIIGLSVAVVVAAGGAWWLFYRFCNVEPCFLPDEMLTNRAGQTEKVNRVMRGRFTLKVNLPNNETTTVTYLLPVDVEGKPLPDASNMVFYAPFTGEAWRNPPSRPVHFYFPEVAGFTIFSLTITVDKADIGNRNRYYVYPEAGWFELIFRIQRIIAERHGLELRSLLAFGQSSGSTMALHLGATYPDRVDAAAGCGGSPELLPQRKNSVAWLALNTWGCSGISAARTFSERMAALDMQVLRGETPPLRKGTIINHHTPNDDAYGLIQLFLRAAASLRQQYGGRMPPSSEWPVSETIVGVRQALPSTEFAAAWRRLPHEVTAQLHRCEIGDATSPFVVFPHATDTDRVVLVVGDADFPVMVQDSLYFLSLRRAVPLAASGHKADVAAWVKTLNTIAADPRWRHLPIHLAVSGFSGRLAAIAALSGGGSGRVAGINTFDFDYNHPDDKFSLEKVRGLSRIPLRMYFRFSAPDGKVPYTQFLSTESDKAMGNQWFELLSSTMDDRTAPSLLPAEGKND